MLSFASPLTIVGGYPVFADTENSDLFHVAPRAPRLTLDANGDPAFALSRYLGDDADGGALVGGFLSLQTELAVPDEDRAAIALHMAETLGREVRLSSAMFDDGRVELVLLGQSPDGGESPFEVDILGSGRASLIGLNTAAFQIGLDHKAASFLEQSIGDPTLPALVVYRLKMSGMQPGYRVEVEADWHRFYKNLESQFKLNVYYVRADLEAKIRETLQDSDIRVKTTVFDGDQQAEADAAEKALFDWITETFFDPAYGQDPPPQPNPAGGIMDEIKNSIFDVVDTLMPGASFKLKFVKEEETRHFSARIDRQMARQREVVFQASLGGVIHGFRVDPETGQDRDSWPALRDRLITGANIAAIPRREVSHGVMDRFASDGLAAVEIDLALKDPDTGDLVHQGSEIFRNGAERKTWAVNLLDEPAAFLTDPYHMRARLHFDPASDFGPLPSMESDWTTGRVSDLVVEPRLLGLYDLTSVEAALDPSFPFAQFARVIVEFRRVEDDGRLSQSGSIILNEESPGGRWIFRGTGANANQYEYRATYQRLSAEGGPIVIDWVPATQRRLTLPDPAPHRRRLSIFVAMPFAGIMRAFLELRYEDADNGVMIDERVNLDADTFAIDRTYAIADAEKQAISYRLTIFAPASLGLVQGDWRETDDTRIVIDESLFQERNIRFRALGLPGADHDVKSLKITGEALSANGDVIAEKRIDVADDAAGSNLGSWSFRMREPDVAQVRVRADWRSGAGFTDSIDWTDVTGDLVVFRLPQKAFL